MEITEADALTKSIDRNGEKVGRKVHERFENGGRKATELHHLFDEEIAALPIELEPIKGKIRDKARQVARELRLDSIRRK